mmetsp:Transcript_15497/g.16793  ORF Transcript_15497/g.16793 Transcript_15497/m.16793 type:complete len:111 (+) Transcript_15497:1203-1535(+)
MNHENSFASQGILCHCHYLLLLKKFAISINSSPKIEFLHYYLFPFLYSIVFSFSFGSSFISAFLLFVLYIFSFIHSFTIEFFFLDSHTTNLLPACQLSIVFVTFLNAFIG